MDVFEDWQLVDSSLKLVYEGLLVVTVFVKAFEAVQFDDVVMSEELRELLVFVPEGAAASKHTVFVVVKRSALRSPVLFFFGLLLNNFFGGFASWVIIGAIFPKSAGAGLHPIVARFSLFLQVRLLVGQVVGWRRRRVS